MGITPTETLRERKRRQTRRRIVAAADRLFAERGFAAVTVAGIGAAAGVSAKTVFNYFPVKEAIFFAEQPVVDERLLRAVRSRPPGASAYEALRRQATRTAVAVGGLAAAVRERRPDETVYDVIERFRAVDASASAAARARAYLASRDLRRYAAERFAAAERELAALLAADTGAPAGDPTPAVAAAALLAPVRIAFAAANERLAADAGPEVVALRAADLDRGFELLAPALRDYARR